MTLEEEIGFSWKHITGTDVFEWSPDVLKDDLENSFAENQEAFEKTKEIVRRNFLAAILSPSRYVRLLAKHLEETNDLQSALIIEEKGG